jgi:hypothetical protein
MTAKLAALVAVIVLAGMSCASAQQTRLYDSRGNSVGTSSTDSQGTTTFRDARGDVVGRTLKPKR